MQVGHLCRWDTFAGGTPLQSPKHLCRQDTFVFLVLNLVEPQSSGIGGGAFMLYWDAKNKTLFSFDGRETAPGAADADYFKDSAGELVKWREARLGPRAVGVPGTLSLLHTVHNNIEKQTNTYVRTRFAFRYLQRTILYII